MSTRSISEGVNAAGAYGWQPCHLHLPNICKFWKPRTPGALRACLGLYRDFCTFIYIYIHTHTHTTFPAIVVSHCCSSPCSSTPLPPPCSSWSCSPSCYCQHVTTHMPIKLQRLTEQTKDMPKVSHLCGSVVRLLTHECAPQTWTARPLDTRNCTWRQPLSLCVSVK